MKLSQISRKLPQILRQELQEFAGLPLAVGFSGGVDSLVLAHALMEARQLWPSQFPEVALFHIDHGQHSQSKEICQWVEQWGSGTGFSVYSTRLQIAPGASEATLRRLRYDAFESLWDQWRPHWAPTTAAKTSATSGHEVRLLLGHHAQDQLETMLFRMLRGTHPLVLKGMAEKSHRGRLHLLRPFLECSKDNLIKYAMHHRLSWKEDPTNTDLSFARNALRHKLLPLLEELRPQSHQKLLQFLTDLKEIQTLSVGKSKTEQQEVVPPFEEVIDIGSVSISQILTWTEILLAADNQKVKRIHWENLQKALKAGAINGEKRTLEFPGGLKVVIHRRKLRFFPGKT